MQEYHIHKARHLFIRHATILFIICKMDASTFSYLPNNFANCNGQVIFEGRLIIAIQYSLY